MEVLENLVTSSAGEAAVEKGIAMSEWSTFHLSFSMGFPPKKTLNILEFIGNIKNLHASAILGRAGCFPAGLVSISQS